MSTTQNGLTVSFPSDTEVQMTRVFSAPRSLVYKCFTQCEHLAKWWGGGTLTECEMDLRVGGKWRRTIKSPEGKDTPFKGEYKEIVPDEILSYTMIMGAEPTTSPEMLETIRLRDEGGKTAVDTIVKLPNQQMRDHMAPHMEKGAGAAYDQLERLIQTLSH